MASSIGRRTLLVSAGAAGIALGTGIPTAANPETTMADGESWRHLFVLNRDPLFMNVGTVGSPPREVLRTESRELERVAREAASNYHGVFDDIRGQIAPGFGADPDELFISGNTTDGIGTVLAGLALNAGDEVLTTNHEHPAVNTPLAILRNRRGIVIKRVVLPVGDNQRAEDYVALFEAAITSRTKVLLFSAPSFRIGTMLPIRMLGELAQRHGLISVVDGAHVPGLFAYKYRELGVDFLAGSGGKWQCGPARTGILYLRNKVLPQFNPNPLPEFWPTITSTQAYPDAGLPPRSTGPTASYDIAALLQDIGNPSLAQMAGFAKACQMWDAIGRQRIEEYSTGLATRLKQGIVERWGVSALYAPITDARLRSALTGFNPFANPADVMDKVKADAFVARMLEEHHITIRNTIVPVAGAPSTHFAMRVSTHLFHRRQDVDRFLDAAWRLSRAMA
ncbi:MAG TPA: aminotransferase class V-fold PLP-dependent enzyme [Candidatus Limnocylindrales bacterium]|nr:aminotransferase class V-fold PLP-dependent enzyme [Candidatus Limnocylindrales bacterium]